MNKEISIKVVDGICGSGKSSWAIQYMNKEGRTGFPPKQFIYVTPYLSEIDRIKEECATLNFVDPANLGKGKMDTLKKLIANGNNIATTHTLFRAIDSEVLELLQDSGYTLILDEVLNVINEYEMKPSDLKLLINDNVCKIENGAIKWIDKTYDGRFNDMKSMCDIGNIYYYRNRFLFWTITPESFRVFDDVFVLTYLFDGQLQRYFYDMHNIQYDMKSVIMDNGEYKLIPYDSRNDNREQLKELLDVYEDTNKSKLNSNYVTRITNTTLSSTNLKGMDESNIRQLKKNIETFFRHQCNAKTSELFWTTLTSMANDLKGGRNTYKTIKDRNRNVTYNRDKCNFVPHNIRATNDYRDRKYCAYVYNRFMHPIEKAFFEDNGVRVNQDLLALSDLIQWLYRGRIRCNQDMKVYIPSRRMRELLYRYLNYEI